MSGRIPGRALFLAGAGVYLGLNLAAFSVSHWMLHIAYLPFHAGHIVLSLVLITLLYRGRSRLRWVVVLLLLGAAFAAMANGIAALARGAGAVVLLVLAVVYLAVAVVFALSATIRSFIGRQGVQE